MALYLDILDASGVRVGTGPIPILSWEHTKRLSRAGTWQAEVPATSPRPSDATSKRRVRCYHFSSAGVRVVGEGIIDERQTKISNNGSTVTIGGDDLLAELGYRLVFAELSTVTSYTPVAAALVGTLGIWFAWDGDEESPELAVQDTDNYVWIGLTETTFNQIDFTFSQPNTIVTSVNIGVSDERGGDLYREPEGVEDTTINAGAPLGQNGSITFTRPASWFTREIGDTGVEVEAYWVRLDPEADLWNDEGLEIGIQFASIVVKSVTPRLDDISYLITFAPSGWSLSPDYYDSTANGTLKLIDGETVLGVFVAISEQTGEQFRLGAGRVVEWLRDLQQDSGIAAVQAFGFPLGMEGAWSEYVLPVPEGLLPPSTPTSFMAQPTGTNNLHIGLSWDDMGADGYIVEYDDGGGWTEIADTASTSYTHTTPTYGIVDHDYRVRGYTSGGESDNATTSQKGRWLGAVFGSHLDEASSNRTTFLSGLTLTDHNTVGSTTGVLGNAAQFVAANNEYLSVADNAALSIGGGDFTIAIWARRTSGGSSYQTVMGKDGFPSPREWALYFKFADTEEFRLILFNSGDGSVGEVSSAALSLSTWYRCVVTRAGSDLKMYINGGTPTTATVTGTPRSSSSADFTVAAPSSAGGYNGDADEPLIIKRAWSAAEIAEDYNSGAGVEYPN